MLEMHPFAGGFSLIRQKNQSITCFRAPTVKQFRRQKQAETANPFSHTTVELFACWMECLAESLLNPLDSDGYDDVKRSR